METQPGLFEGPSTLPEGCSYEPQFITADEERTLLARIERLAFADVVMRGALAKRRTAHFGWTYGYYSRRTEPGPPLPEFLIGPRAKAAAWAGIDADAFAEALITEYPAGATIGWHRDAPMFGDVIAGVSLLTSARMKFRPYVSPADIPSRPSPRRTTHEIELAPRSGYLLTGVARRDFEHSIPAVSALRYSITFRTLRV